MTPPATPAQAQAPAPPSPSPSRRVDTGLDVVTEPQLFGSCHRGRLTDAGRRVRTLTGHPAEHPRVHPWKSASSISTINWAWWRRSRGDDALQHVLVRFAHAGSITSCRRQLTDPVLGGEARRRTADRCTSASRTRAWIRLAVFQGERPWSSAPWAEAEVPYAVLRPAIPSEGTGAPPTTSPGSCATCRSSAVGGGGTTDPGYPRRPTWRQLCVRKGPSGTTASSTPWVPNGRPSSNWSPPSAT